MQMDFVTLFDSLLELNYELEWDGCTQNCSVSICLGIPPQAHSSLWAKKILHTLYDKTYLSYSDTQ